MKKKSYTVALSAQELLARAKKGPIRKVKESQIDFSDMPELSSEQLAKFKRVGRPLLGNRVRVAISLRLDEEVLEKLRKRARKEGVGYQSLINEILKKAV